MISSTRPARKTITGIQRSTFLPWTLSRKATYSIIPKTAYSRKWTRSSGYLIAGRIEAVIPKMPKSKTKDFHPFPCVRKRIMIPRATKKRNTYTLREKASPKFSLRKFKIGRMTGSVA
jgi:hypothetical protein